MPLRSTTPRSSTLRSTAALALALLAPFALSPTLPAQDNAPSIVGSSPLPGLAGATGWLNSPPLTARELRGKVVLVDFWDYSCINCIRAVPYVRAWADKYKSAGLVVIGVHTPEFDTEKIPANVEKAVHRFNITYPVALDPDMKVWNSFHNQYWPAHYFIDRSGKVRFEHFGEGSYDESEHWIQQLLAEGTTTAQPSGTVAVHGTGEQAAADMADVHSPETYIGFARAHHFSSPGGLHPDSTATYTAPAQLSLNDWALTGSWLDHRQVAILQSAPGRITFRFHARDLHLVLGPTAQGKPVRFRVTLDGQAPGTSHGADIDPQGNGTVRDDRLYQLIRQPGPVADHTFTIEFLDPGVQAFSFTFG